MLRSKMTHEQVQQYWSLEHKNREKVIDCLTLFLVGQNGYCFNLREVAATVYGNPNDEYNVWLILRAFNFSEQDSGRYRNGYRGREVNRRTFEAYVDEFSDGTFLNGDLFEDFLKRDTFSQNAGQADIITYSVCPSCQRTVSEDFAFCPYCGGRMGSATGSRLFCSCGYEFSPNAEYCPVCGKSVDEANQPIRCKNCGTVSPSGTMICCKCGAILCYTRMR